MQFKNKTINKWKASTAILVSVIIVLSCFVVLYQPQAGVAAQPNSLNVSIEGPKKLGATETGTYTATVNNSYQGNLVYSWSIDPINKTVLVPFDNQCNLTFIEATEEPYLLKVEVHDSINNFGVCSMVVYDPPTFPNLYLGDTGSSYSYKICVDQSGSWYYAVNGQTGAISWSSTNASYVINTAIANGGSESKIVLSGDGWVGSEDIILTAPIDISTNHNFGVTGITLEFNSIRVAYSGSAFILNGTSANRIKGNLITMDDANSGNLFYLANTYGNNIDVNYIYHGANTGKAFYFDGTYGNIAHNLLTLNRVFGFATSIHLEHGNTFCNDISFSRLQSTSTFTAINITSGSGTGNNAFRNGAIQADHANDVGIWTNNANNDNFINVNISDLLASGNATVNTGVITLTGCQFPINKMTGSGITRYENQFDANTGYSVGQLPIVAHGEVYDIVNTTANILTYTVPYNRNTTYLVGLNLYASTYVSSSGYVQVAFTDTGGNSRSIALRYGGGGGYQITYAGFYAYEPQTIWAKAGTTITIQTTLTTGVTYDASAYLTEMYTTSP